MQPTQTDRSDEVQAAIAQSLKEAFLRVKDRALERGEAAAADACDAAAASLDAQILERTP